MDISGSANVETIQEARRDPPHHPGRCEGSQHVMTNSKLQEILKEWGFWMSIEGRRYHIFESHRLLIAGSRQEILRWFVETKRDREIGWTGNYTGS